MKDKIILATVNAKKMLYSTTANEYAAIAPIIQLGLLSAYIKSKNIAVEMIDSDIGGLSIDGFISTLEQEQPLLVGIVCSGANPSSSTMTMAGGVDFFKKFNQREDKIKTFIWGANP